LSTLTAGTARPAGRTPVVAVSGKGPGRISIVGLICLKPWHRGRLM